MGVVNLQVLLPIGTGSVQKRRVQALATTTGSRNLNTRANWFTTIRGRLGLTVCDALMYVTGGAAVTRDRTNWDLAGVTPALSSRFSQTRWGWTAGAGTELMLGCNWSVGAEFLYLNFGQRTRTGLNTATTPATYRFGHDSNLWLARFLVNYRIGNLCCGY